MRRRLALKGWLAGRLSAMFSQLPGGGVNAKASREAVRSASSGLNVSYSDSRLRV